MKLFWVMGVMLPFVGQGQPVNYAQQQGFTIAGKMAGAPDKSAVFVTDANNPVDTLAKGVVAGEKFTVRGKLTEPGIYDIGFAGVTKKARVFLENTQMTFTGNAAGAEPFVVKGSKAQQDFDEFQQTFNPLFQQLNQLNEQAKIKGMTEGLVTESNKLVSEIKVQVEKFSTAKKSSPVTPLLLVATAQLTNDVQQLEKRFASLTPDVRKGYYGRYLSSMLETMKVGAVGTPAINFTQNDTEGKPVSLASFKGKYVLIDFWASWCGPCRQENPNVVNTYNQYKNKNFTVLGVSLDRSRDAWLQAIKADGLAWTHVSDLKFWNNEVAQKYKVQSIPQNYLIDPNGKIIARDLRGEALRQRLGELIK